jgi:S1-C subfamily serine protease
MRRCLSIVRAVALFSALLIACASEPPPLPPPVAEPIPLGPEGSRSLTFLHVVTRIPAGTLLGVARWRGSNDLLDEIRASGGATRSKEYNVAITDLLRAHGYTVRDEVDAVFDLDGGIRARYQMAGVIHDLELDYEYKRSHRAGIVPRGSGTAAVSLELRVFDLVKKRTVFQSTYRGTGTDRGTEPQPVVPAVVNAVRQALADPDFVASVAGVEPAEAPRAGTNVTRCRAKTGRLPGGMSDALESVVVVRAGAASGGGVIVSEEGHVITAEHVVRDSDEVFVVLRSGPMIPARVVSRSASHDLVLLELPGHGYRCAPTTRSKVLPIGSEVFTINILLGGNKPTVSRGVVSGYQEINGRRYIQTDASINTGSSGSPIFDEAGMVGGIVTRKFVGFGVEGVCLGVPIVDLDRWLDITWD